MFTTNFRISGYPEYGRNTLLWPAEDELNIYKSIKCIIKTNYYALHYDNYNGSKSEKTHKS